MSGQRTRNEAAEPRRWRTPWKTRALIERLERAEERLAKIERTRTRSSPRRGVTGDAFVAAAKEVFRHGRTLLGEDRLWILWQAARNAGSLELPAAEVGSYRGGSAFLVARALERTQGSAAPLEVIDTFEGHPSGDPTPADHPMHHAGHFGDTSFEEVCAYLAPFPNVTVRKGAFADVAPALPHSAFGLVHLDVDLYSPTKACLEYFEPRLAVGGVIVLDDYGARKCPGVQQAAEEFVSRQTAFHAWHAHTEQLVLVRTRT